MTVSDFLPNAPEPGTSKPMWIAVDAMGADFAPALAIDACKIALNAQPSFCIRLFGDAGQLQPTIDALSSAQAERIELVDVAEQIEMDSSPAHALRRGDNSSMAQALDSLLPDSRLLDIQATRSSQSQALVSSGNTG
ncbi:MAG: hypothetical protein AAF446_03145, partial [Pseudomonadota bacterium]